MPKVYNRDGHETIPTDAVFIGRPSKFGNPFVIGTHGTREEVLASFREWLITTEDGRAAARAAASELPGKDLICFCAPEPCHGDVLLDIANRN